MRSGVGVEAAIVGPDSDSNSRLVTTAPGDSNSGSDSYSATLVPTVDNVSLCAIFRRGILSWAAFETHGTVVLDS